MLTPAIQKLSEEEMTEYMSDLKLNKEQYVVLNIENIANNINQFSQNKDLIEVAKVETILSKFQVAVEEVKRKVKRFLASSLGNLALIIFDFSFYSNNSTENYFEEAIIFVEVSKLN